MPEDEEISIYDVRSDSRDADRWQQGFVANVANSVGNVAIKTC